MTENYVEIGRIVKTHGYKGSLKINFRDNLIKESLNDIEAFFISGHQGKRPYFIDTLEIIGENEGLLKLEGISGKEAAEEIKGEKIFVRGDEKIFILQAVEKFDGFTGFQLFNQNTLIGMIADVIHLPMQQMAVLEVDGREILIPLHEDLILEKRMKNKQLIMKLPEGLIDVGEE